MKRIILLGSILIFSTLPAGTITMPKEKTYYISGVAFDTKTYCADFSLVIEAQAKKIQALEEELFQLRKLQQQKLSEKLEKAHQSELKKATQKPSEDSSNQIIISDKPIH